MRSALVTGSVNRINFFAKKLILFTKPLPIFILPIDFEGLIDLVHA